MSDEMTAAATDVLPCGCGDGLVCARHKHLAEYNQAFHKDSKGSSELPNLVLQASFKTWYSQMDRFRKTIFMIFVVIAPVVVAALSGSVWSGLVVFSLFAVPLSLCLLTLPNNRLVLNPRERTVTFRNWRRKSTTISVDDQMRAAAFQYIDIGVTQSAVTVVLWKPDGAVRMDQRAWGFEQLEDVIVALGVHVGGVASDKDIEAAFPGTLPFLARHPKASAFGIIGAIFAIIVAAAFLASLGSTAQDESQPREPTITEVNGPKPTAMPPDVASRQDALTASLQQAVGVTEWTEQAEIHPCPEQDGWQREVTYLSAVGGKAPDVVAKITAAVRDYGLTVDRNETRNETLSISTAYGSDSGAEARLYIYDYEQSGDFYNVSLTTSSECVITPR